MINTLRKGYNWIFINKQICPMVSLSMFSGWMISFPINMQLLGVFAAARGVDRAEIVMLFIGCHAIGLIVFGMTVNDRAKIPGLITAAGGLCIILCILIWFCSPVVCRVLFSVLGLASAACITGWSSIYIKEIKAIGRIFFISGTILTACAIKYVLGILQTFMALQLLFILLLLPLLISIILPLFTGLYKSGKEVEAEPERRFPGLFLIIMCFIIFFPYMNSGLAYHVLIPHYTGLQGSMPYISGLASMLAMAVMMGISKRLKLNFLIYIVLALIGLSFVAFGLFSGGSLGLIAAQALMEVASSVLILLIFVILGYVAAGIHRPLRVFGLVLFFDAAAFFCGGLIGEQLLKIEEGFQYVTALFAVCGIFIVLPAVPWLSKKIGELTGEEEYEPLTVAVPEIDKCQDIAVNDDNEIENEKDCPLSFLPNGEKLTSRERQITLLILKGYSNRELVESLYISENTIKTHLRHIFRKLGVSSRRDLILMSMKNNEGAGL